MGSPLTTHKLLSSSSSSLIFFLFLSSHLPRLFLLKTRLHIGRRGCAAAPRSGVAASGAANPAPTNEPSAPPSGPPPSSPPSPSAAASPPPGRPHREVRRCHGAHAAHSASATARPSPSRLQARAPWKRKTTFGCVWRYELPAPTLHFPPAHFLNYQIIK